MNGCDAALLTALAYLSPFSSQGLILLIAAALVGVVTVELIRRRLLRESYAMLWLLIAAVLLVFAIFPSLLFWISERLGLYYLTVVFLTCFLLLMAIVMQYSIVLSQRAEENRQLVQRVALLQQRLERLEGRLDATGPGQADQSSPEPGKTPSEP